MAVNSSTPVVRLALPKGRLLTQTAELLTASGLGFANYNSKTRTYRLQSDTVPGLIAKMLNERDIPIQVAIGNYDFGICSSDWLQELLFRYPSSQVYKLADLTYDLSSIYLACHAGAILTPEDIISSDKNWRIVTEYPALAEAAACRMRLKRFHIFPLWGAADAYPPENADFAVLKAADGEDLYSMNLRPVRRICASNACVIANRDSLESGDLSMMLTLLGKLVSSQTARQTDAEKKTAIRRKDAAYSPSQHKVWLALPDGHQQVHTINFLQKAGIRLEGYSQDNLQRRPSSDFDWLNIKVIRPQDMPQQVANGNFDLAITGNDWLLDHLYQFPSSPVKKLLDLGFGKVRIVAVAAEEAPVTSIEDIKRLIATGKMTTLRIASEYINIADRYLRDRHIQRYRVIPTWGATEVYLPEDADMLIENTETGQTLARHKLKILDTLFESTACLIGNSRSLSLPYKHGKIAKLVSIFKEAAS